MEELKWNRDFALEQAGDDKELLDELVVLFNDSSASDLRIIQESLASEDPQAMADAAHSIKGAAASLGIEGIREVAASIESIGKSGVLEGAASLAENLALLLDRFRSVT